MEDILVLFHGGFQPVRSYGGTFQSSSVCSQVCVATPRERTQGPSVAQVEDNEDKDKAQTSSDFRDSQTAKGYPVVWLRMASFKRDDITRQLTKGNHGEQAT